jgi:hypothetical protein
MIIEPVTIVGQFFRFLSENVEKFHGFQIGYNGNATRRSREIHRPF